MEIAACTAQRAPDGCGCVWKGPKFPAAGITDVTDSTDHIDYVGGRPLSKHLISREKRSQRLFTPVRRRLTDRNRGSGGCDTKIVLISVAMRMRPGLLHSFEFRYRTHPSPQEPTMIWAVIEVIVVGFVAGLIARTLLPGPQNPQGFLQTTALGILGAFVATVIGYLVGWYQPASNQTAGVIASIIGAIVVLFIWHRVQSARLARR